MADSVGQSKRGIDNMARLSCVINIFKNPCHFARDLLLPLLIRSFLLFRQKNDK